MCKTSGDGHRWGRGGEGRSAKANAQDIGGEKGRWGRSGESTKRTARWLRGEAGRGRGGRRLGRRGRPERGGGCYREGDSGLRASVPQPLPQNAPHNTDMQRSTVNRELFVISRPALYLTYCHKKDWFKSNKFRSSNDVYYEMRDERNVYFPRQNVYSMRLTAV